MVTTAWIWRSAIKHLEVNGRPIPNRSLSPQGHDHRTAKPWRIWTAEAGHGGTWCTLWCYSLTKSPDWQKFQQKYSFLGYPTNIHFISWCLPNLFSFWTNGNYVNRPWQCWFGKRGILCCTCYSGCSALELKDVKAKGLKGWERGRFGRNLRVLKKINSMQLFNEFCKIQSECLMVSLTVAGSIWSLQSEGQSLYTMWKLNQARPKNFCSSACSDSLLPAASLSCCQEQEM